MTLISVRPIPKTEVPAQPTPGVLASPLHILGRVLADTEQAARLNDLLSAGSKAISRIVLSVGVVLVGAITLAAIMIHFAGLGSAIGGGIAVGGTGAAWLARSLWTRIKAKKATK
jgi:hypothetical protein